MSKPKDAKSNPEAPAEQSQRLVEAARELGVDPGADIDDVMKLVAAKRPKPYAKSKKAQRASNHDK